jgi:hypothetical protein
LVVKRLQPKADNPPYFPIWYEEWESVALHLNAPELIYDFKNLGVKRMDRVL